jgi:hypothetical protein
VLFHPIVSCAAQNSRLKSLACFVCVTPQQNHYLTQINECSVLAVQNGVAKRQRGFVDPNTTTKLSQISNAKSLLAQQKCHISIKGMPVSWPIQPSPHHSSNSNVPLRVQNALPLAMCGLCCAV